jgi:hypothetical protein
MNAERQRVTVQMDVSEIKTSSSQTPGLNFSAMTGEWYVEGDIRSLLSSNPESILEYANNEFSCLFMNPPKGTFFDCQNLKLGEASTVIGPGSFLKTFYGNTAGTSGTRTPPEIPFTGKAAPYCLRLMFGFDSVMTTTPSIHFSELAEGAFMALFYQCLKITSGPKEFCPDADFQTIPAYCFQQTFYMAKKMESVKMDLSTVRHVGTSGLQSMFAGCASLSDMGLGEGESLVLSFDTVGVVMDMFYQCASLPYSVDLDITASQGSPCCQMFQGCAKIPEASFTLTLTGSHSSDSNGAFEGMFSGCTSLEHVSGTIDVDGVTDSANRMCCQMFQGCTSL